MARRRKGLSERHKKVLKVLADLQDEQGYPPTIREIGRSANISSTSVVNYYLEQLEEMGYIERDRNKSRGVRLLKSLREKVENLIRIPVVGRIVASAPVPVPSSDFSYFDAESMVEVARSLVPTREENELFALEVQGDSMIDAMVNDGDIVIMQRAQEARNGEMVAVWLQDKDETTLKYFFREKGRVRLQPANPTMGAIYVNDPASLQVQGKVMMVIRQVGSRVN
ncbi:MAG: transcriptional repressor LexA [Anaerolineales bacterium]